MSRSSRLFRQPPPQGFEFNATDVRREFAHPSEGFKASFMLSNLRFRVPAVLALNLSAVPALTSPITFRISV